MHTRGKGIALSYLKVSANMISGLVLSAVLLRILGATEYGIYQTVASFANQLILLEFGVGTVMTRNISLCRGTEAPEKEIQRNISSLWTITCGLSLFVVMVATLFYFAIPSIYMYSLSSSEILRGQRIYVVVVGQVFFTFLNHSINAVILAYENYTYASIQSIIRIVMRTILIVGLVFWWKNAIVIAVVDCGLSGVCCVVSWVYCKKTLKVGFRFGQCDWRIIRASLPLTIAIFLQAIVGQVNNNVDKIVIGAMMSPEPVAVYSVAMYIFSVFSTLLNVPASMYTPTITQKVAQGVKGQQLVEELVLPSRLTAFTGGLILFGVAAVGRQFVEILYGSQYLIAWPIAIILMLPTYLDNVIGSLVYVLDAMNKRLARSVVLIITTAMNVILTIAWIPQWGIIGAAAATALCTMLGPVLVMGVYYRKKLQIPVLRLYLKAFRGILPCLVLGAVVGFFAGQLFSNSLLSFVLGGCVYVAIAAGGSYVLGMTREEKLAICGYINRKIHKA